MKFHGGYYGKKEKVIDFSVNLNPLGIPIELKRSLKECFNKWIISKYPDYNYRELKFAISEFYQLSSKFIFPTNGASEAIQLSILASKPKFLVYISPTYGDDCLLANALKIKCIHIMMDVKDHEFSVNLDEIIRHVRKLRKAAIVWSNPNNPTGTLTEPEPLIEAANSFPRESMLIIDEVYAELSGFRGLLTVKELPDNIIIIRSFTKVFGVPGLRIGFAYTRSRKHIKRVRSIAPDWNVNALASCALEKSLRENKEELHNFIDLSATKIKKLRKRLIKELRNIGLNVFNSRSNYVLIRHEGVKAKLLQKMLLEKYGLFLRPANTFHGLNEFYTRISVRTSRENKILVNALERVLKGN